MPDVEPETEAWETYAQDFSGEVHTTVPLVQENLQGPVITSTKVRIENSISSIRDMFVFAPKLLPWMIPLW
jgi:hypothetical protein